MASSEHSPVFAPFFNVGTNLRLTSGVVDSLAALSVGSAIATSVALGRSGQPLTIGSISLDAASVPSYTGAALFHSYSTFGITDILGSISLQSDNSDITLTAGALFGIGVKMIVGATEGLHVNHIFDSGSPIQVKASGNFIVNQPVFTGAFGSAPLALLVTGGAHTTLAASTEANDVRFALARTVQFATGALTTQRACLIQAPTYSFVGASTITTAATVSISGPPIAGTNAIITNPLSFLVESGLARFDGEVRTGPLICDNIIANSDSNFGGDVDIDNNLAVLGVTTLTGDLTFNNGLKVHRTVSAAGSYTVLTTDYIIGKTGITGGGDTINLPASATAGTGKVYIIKDESGTAGTNNITIDPNAAETIDGAATKVINTNFGSATIYTDGSNWFIT